MRCKGYIFLFTIKPIIVKAHLVRGAHKHVVGAHMVAHNDDQTAFETPC